VTHSDTTLVGYAGTDPTTLAVIVAMNAVLLQEVQWAPRRPAER
jgi:hypothetical protein